MSLQDFKYYFLEEDGRSIFRQGNVVNSSGRHQPQALSPDGWQEIVVGWQRDMAKYYGLTRNFSLPLKFVGDSAFIVRNEFIRRNIERKIFLLIQQLQLEYTDDYYKFIYKYLYKGQLDFSTCHSDLDQVTANIMEGGLAKQLKAGENTSFTIPFDDDAIDIFMDGILLFETQNFLITAATHVEAIGSNEHLVGIVTTTNDGTASGAVFFSIYYQEMVPADYTSDPNYFLVFSQTITVRFKGSFVMNLPIAGLYELKLKSSNGSSVTIFSGTLGIGEHTIAWDINFTGNSGDRFFLVGFADGTGPSTAYEYKEGTADISFSAKHPGTTIRAFEPAVLYRKLIEKITGNADNAQSDLLIANSGSTATCGDAIRGIASATIKTSLTDFFADYNISCFAGLGIKGGKIVMEDRATFFDPTNPIDLGQAKSHEWYEAADLLGNVYKIGSLKPEIEDVNGKFDPNGSTNYLTPIQSIVKDIDMVGPYKKGPYEIETIRQNLDGKTTTDDNSDNQVFVINAVPGRTVVTTVSFGASLNVMTLNNGIEVIAGQRLKISGSASNNGYFPVISVASILVAQLVTLDGTVTDESGVEITIKFPHILDRTPIVTASLDVCASPETIFNVRYTPKNFFMKHRRWIHSQMHGFDGEKITFGTGDKNTKFIATVDGVVIDEDKAEDIATLGPKLFLPVYHDIEVPVTPEVISLLEDDPNRCFQFTDENGITLKGFNIKSAVAPNTLQSQKFTLLSCPDNDLTQLIN